MKTYEIEPLELNEQTGEPEVWTVIIREKGKASKEHGSFGSIQEAQFWIENQPEADPPVTRSIRLV